LAEQKTKHDAAARTRTGAEASADISYSMWKRGMAMRDAGEPAQGEPGPWMLRH
jgi:hypothetical protein